jgi:hypothetical protein
MTGAFVGFYLNGFTAVLKGQGISAASFADPLVVVLFHLVLLAVGTIVYVMQLWYRAWKEHYIEVCYGLRQHFIPSIENESPFPFWLRRAPTTGGKFSFDNLVMYVTLLVNVGVLFLLAYDILELVNNPKVANLGIAALFVAYLALTSALNRRMRSPGFLDA